MEKRQGKTAWNRKTHEQFLDDLKEKKIQYIPLGKYQGASVKMKFRCEKCGCIWDAKPTNILSGKGCPDCKKRKLAKINGKTHREFVEEAERKNSNVIILGKYINDDTPIMVVCRIHNILYTQSPMVILRGCGCPECMKEKISIKNRSTVEHFMKRATKNSSHLEVISPDKYKNAKTKMEVRCRVHHNTFWSFADNIAIGNAACPICSMSNGEHAVAMYLDTKGYDYITQYIPEDGELGKRRFDFFIPSMNTIIEYDGAQHFIPVKHWGGEEELKEIIKNDNIKNDYCKRKGIKMIRIPYTEKDINSFLFAAGI